MADAPQSPYNPTGVEGAAAPQTDADGGWRDAPKPRKPLCSRRCKRRTRRGAGAACSLLGDVLFVAVDTLKVWKTRDSAGIGSNPRRTPISCKTRIRRWVFLLGAFALTGLLAMFQASFADARFVQAFLALGVVLGLAVGTARTCCFHRRLCCYRKLPAARRKTRRLQITSRTDGEGLLAADGSIPPKPRSQQSTCRQLCWFCFTEDTQRVLRLLYGSICKDIVPVAVMGGAAGLYSGLNLGYMHQVLLSTRESENWIIVQGVLFMSILLGLGTFLVMWLAVLARHWPPLKEPFLGACLLKASLLGVVVSYCVAGWGAVYGLVLGFFQAAFLRYRNTTAALAAVGFIVAFGFCCCLPGLLVYRYYRSVKTPELQVITMDLLNEMESQKDPNRGMGKAGAHPKHDDALDTFVPYKGRTATEARTRWAAKDLRFDEFVHGSAEYIVQQGKRRHMRLNSVVNQAEAMQASIQQFNRTDVTTAKQMEWAQVCASALKYGNLDRARELLEQGCPPNAVVENAPLLSHAILGRNSAPAVRLLLEFGARVADPFARLDREAARRYQAQKRNAERFDKDDFLEVDEETAEKLSMVVELGGYASATKDHIAVILDSTEAPKYRDDITSLAPLHLAAMTGDSAVMRALLVAGADPNIRTYVEERTPMHIACSYGRHVAVRELSNCKDTLDLTAVDKNGVSIADELDLLFSQGVTDAVQKPKQRPLSGRLAMKEEQARKNAEEAARTAATAGVDDQDADGEEPAAAVGVTVSAPGVGAGAAAAPAEDATGGGEAVVLSRAERLRAELAADTEETRAQAVKASGKQRRRRLRKEEVRHASHGRRLEAGFRQLRVEEAEREDDIIEVLGQMLENKQLWAHPKDRGLERKCLRKVAEVESSDSEEEPLAPHRGRFNLGDEAAEDSDSSGVDSILQERDTRKKMYGVSDSDDDSEVERARQAARRRAASSGSDSV